MDASMKKRIAVSHHRPQLRGFTGVPSAGLDLDGVMTASLHSRAQAPMHARTNALTHTHTAVVRMHLHTHTAVVVVCIVCVSSVCIHTRICIHESPHTNLYVCMHPHTNLVRKGASSPLQSCPASVLRPPPTPPCSACASLSFDPIQPLISVLTSSNS